MCRGRRRRARSRGLDRRAHQRRPRVGGSGGQDAGAEGSTWLPPYTPGRTAALFSYRPATGAQRRAPAWCARRCLVYRGWCASSSCPGSFLLRTPLQESDGLACDSIFECYHIFIYYNITSNVPAVHALYWRGLTTAEEPAYAQIPRDIVRRSQPAGLTTRTMSFIDMTKRRSARLPPPGHAMSVPHSQHGPVRRSSCRRVPLVPGARSPHSTMRWTLPTLEISYE